MTKDRKAKRAARLRQDLADGHYSEARRSADWPPGMVLSIDTPNHITELLFLRMAWGLPTRTMVPPLDPVPDTGVTALPSTASLEEWGRRWDEQWARAWAWYRIEQRVGGLAGITPEQYRELVGDGTRPNPVIPPFWSMRYGDDGFDREAHSAWYRTLIRIPHAPLQNQPERVSVRAVTAAWRTGLDSIIVLPYAGDYAERVTVRHLVVSDHTWQTTSLRERALALPITGLPGSPEGDA